jgi:hypothetical protein
LQDCSTKQVALPFFLTSFGENYNTQKEIKQQTRGKDMTESEIRRMEGEIRARKDDGEHNTKIAVVSILLGCFAGVLGALLAQWVINTFLK